MTPDIDHDLPAELQHKPMLVDLTVEEGTRLKVLYGSQSGFHAVDLDSARYCQITPDSDSDVHQISDRDDNIFSISACMTSTCPSTPRAPCPPIPS